MNGVVGRVRFRRDHRWAPGQMSAYLDRELASRARTRLEHHTAECPECRGVLEGLRRMLGLLHRLSPPDPPEAAEIVAAVRARLHDPSDRAR
jgi:anti-sigma factor RsiW